MPISETLAKSLRAIRAERGLSERDVARLCKVGRGTIINIEAQDNSPSLATCEKIAKGLRVDLARLLGLL